VGQPAHAGGSRRGWGW